jgi:ribosomal protein S27E
MAPNLPGPAAYNARVADRKLKRCSRCGRRKPLDEFGPHRYRPDGRRDRCRDCNNEAAREAYGAPASGTVACRICGAALHVVAGRHLELRHGVTAAEYRGRYPDAPLSSDHYRGLQRDLSADGGGIAVPVWTKRAIIAALRDATRRRGEPPSARDWEKHRPPARTVTRVFGTWNAALEAAGLPTRAPSANLADLNRPGVKRRRRIKA